MVASKVALRRIMYCSLFHRRSRVEAVNKNRFCSDFVESFLSTFGSTFCISHSVYIFLMRCYCGMLPFT